MIEDELLTKMMEWQVQDARNPFGKFIFSDSNAAMAVLNRIKMFLSKDCGGF